MRPDTSLTVLRTALEAVWITVVYAVTGMSVALLLALPLGVAASGNLVRRPAIRRISMVAARVLLGFQRAIHELVWAWLFVAAIGLSPFAAIFAIGIPYAGILGRIYADLLNDVPEGPLQALRGAGASEPVVFLYGRLPAVAPALTSYTFYRFECAIRSSAIMSFVGLSGLGYQINIALDDLQYQQVGTYLLALFLLVVASDVVSNVVRQRLVG
jgi:phosphonate transport system permease protein